MSTERAKPGEDETFIGATVLAALTDAVAVLVVWVGVVHVVADRCGAGRDPEKVDASQVRQVTISKVVHVAILDDVVVGLGRRVRPSPADGDAHVVEIGDLAAEDGGVRDLLDQKPVALVVHGRALHKCRVHERVVIAAVGYVLQRLPGADSDPTGARVTHKRGVDRVVRRGVLDPHAVCGTAARAISSTNKKRWERQRRWKT